MSMQKLKKAAIAALSFVSALVLVGCGGSSDDSSSSDASGGDTTGGEATAWVLTGDPNESIWRDQIEAFNCSNGVTWTVEAFENDQYKEKIRTAVGAGEAPTLIMGWGQTGALNEYIAADKVVDLTGKLPDLEAKILPSVFAGGQVDGKQYAAPNISSQPIVMFYNQKLFAEVGKEIPTNWSEFLALIPVFKEAGIIPVALAGGQQWTDMMWAEYLVDNVAGAGAFEAVLAGEANAWTNPDIVEAMTMLDEFIAMEPFNEGFTSMSPGDNEDLALIATDQAAMMLHGAWLVGTLQNDYDADVVENVLVSTFPGVEGGKGDPSDLVGNLSNYWSVSSDATPEAQECAIEYLNSGMYSDTIIDRMIENGMIPPVDGIEDKIEATGRQGVIAQYDMIKAAANYQLSWDQALSSEASAQLLSDLAKVFNQEMTGEEYCKDMDNYL